MNETINVIKSSRNIRKFKATQIPDARANVIADVTDPFEGYYVYKVNFDNYGLYNLYT